MVCACLLPGPVWVCISQERDRCQRRWSYATPAKAGVEEASRQVTNLPYGGLGGAEGGRRGGGPQYSVLSTQLGGLHPCGGEAGPQHSVLSTQHSVLSPGQGAGPQASDGIRFLDPGPPEADLGPAPGWRGKTIDRYTAWKAGVQGATPSMALVRGAEPEARQVTNLPYGVWVACTHTEGRWAGLVRKGGGASVLSTQHSVLSTQLGGLHPCGGAGGLSTQHSVLSTQYSALSTQSWAGCGQRLQ